MTRNNFDIPEPFRRAMEDVGWSDQDGGRGGRPPFPGGPNPPIQLGRPLILIGIIVALLIAASWLVTLYTDWLWFSAVDYFEVWITQWLARIATFLAFFAVAAVVLLLNWLVARRQASKNTPPFNPQFLQVKFIRWIVAAAAMLVALAFGSAGADRWETFLLYLNRMSYGVADPIFNRDVSFYLFELPVFDFVQNWLLSLFLVTLLGIVPIYAINFLPEIQQGTWRPDQFPALRKHVALIGALFLVFWAIGHALDIFGLLFSPRGVVFGASYTDMNASLWALYAQVVLMTLTALALLLNFFRVSLRPVLATGGLWLAATILVGVIFPGLLQRYAVEPNEIERERPFIEHNIRLTRLAYGLDDVDTRPIGNVTGLEQDDLDQNQAVLQNVRLWDYRPLQATYEQLQALRPYYQFTQIDIDRYEIDGKTRQVMLAGRELDKSNLPAPSWVNRNLEFTHGYGIVMNPVDQVSSDGQPQFFIQDLPPISNVSIEVNRPEIYYGEMTTDVVFVSSGREEFSYPSGNENVYSSYEGTGGVALDSYFKRILYAIRFGDANILLSDEINTRTRVQYHRQIQERIRLITPFLALDQDPYLVVADGRLFWIQDAYTLSNRFPYSTPIGNRFNYIRNAAKIVVDAYNGEITYYLADESDPITLAYARAFPTLFRPLDEMPPSLFSHIRYPEDLFRVQTQQYLTYHMQDVRVFYNKEDLWQIPDEILDSVEQPMEPYYVILTLPGEEDSEYLLIQPLNPAGKPNMIAWFAARNDGANYGELIVYELPKQELVFGPIQVEGRINQETEISQQFSLWDQRGSSIIRGNLLVIPLNDSFLYVEPVYLLSETNPLPELKRVIVASDTRIAMRETLAEALDALLLDAPAVDSFEGDEGVAEVESEPVAAAEESTDTADSAVTEAETSEETASGTIEDALSGSAAEVVEAVTGEAELAALIDSANAHFQAAEAAQRTGDWATYGAELAALEADLARLMELTGSNP